eukprot:9503919-Pyramimonas_sp.AAC.1
MSNEGFKPQHTAQLLLPLGKSEKNNTTGGKKGSAVGESGELDRGGEKRGRVSGMLSAPLPAQEDPKGGEKGRREGLRTMHGAHVNGGPARARRERQELQHRVVSKHVTCIQYTCAPEQ